MLLMKIMRIIKILKTKKKSANIILLFIYIFILFPALINLKTIQYQLNSYQDQYIKSSYTWATLDLTNPTGINQSSGSSCADAGKILMRVLPLGILKNLMKPVLLRLAATFLRALLSFDISYLLFVFLCCFFND